MNRTGRQTPAITTANFDIHNVMLFKMLKETTETCKRVGLYIKNFIYILYIYVRVGTVVTRELGILNVCTITRNNTSLHESHDFSQ